MGIHIKDVQGQMFVWMKTSYTPAKCSTNLNLDLETVRLNWTVLVRRVTDATVENTPSTTEYNGCTAVQTWTVRYYNINHI